MKCTSVCCLLLLFLLPAFAQAPSPSQDVDVEFTQGTDFSRYHSFTFAGPDDPFIDVALEQRMITAVSQELEAKGMRSGVFEDQFDLTISYGGQVEQDPARPELKRVSLWFRIVDTKQGVVVWRGSGVQPLTGDEQQDLALGRALIGAIFAQYPPTQ